MRLPNLSLQLSLLWSATLHSINFLQFSSTSSTSSNFVQILFKKQVFHFILKILTATQNPVPLTRTFYSLSTQFVWFICKYQMGFYCSIRDRYTHRWALAFQIFYISNSQYPSFSLFVFFFASDQIVHQNLTPEGIFSISFSMDHWWKIRQKCVSLLFQHWNLKGYSRVKDWNGTE